MSLISRIVGTAARASVIAVGTAVASSVLVGLDQRRGAKPALPEHDGPYSEEERAESVRTYITALTLPAAAFTIPFAEDCVRYENGLKTGFNASQMKWDLHVHLQYSAIKEIVDLTLNVDPEGAPGVVRAEFTVKALFGVRAYVREDFRVPAEDCLIHRIDATISPQRITSG